MGFEAQLVVLLTLSTQSKKAETLAVFKRGIKLLHFQQKSQAVKRNIDSFPPDFMFELTNNEKNELIIQKFKIMTNIKQN